MRGANGESAASVLAQVTPENRYAFDQQCRVQAIQGAARAGLLDGPARLSINFLPNAVYSPQACIQLTLATAAALDFPTERLTFEFTENEEMGFGVALDDFGAGHAGLNLLARFQPDIIKLDMELIRGVDQSLPRKIIVEGVVKMRAALGVTVIAEGIETDGELETLRAIGVRYIQGFLLARPGFQSLPVVAPERAPRGLTLVKAGPGEDPQDRDLSGDAPWATWSTS